MFRFDLNLRLNTIVNINTFKHKVTAAYGKLSFSTALKIQNLLLLVNQVKFISSRNWLPESKYKIYN